jgi:hypothetical protein
MQMELQVKAADCWDNSCPARFAVTSSEGGYVVVGKKLKRRDRRKLRGQVGKGEAALWVPPEIIKG